MMPKLKRIEAEGTDKRVQNKLRYWSIRNGDSRGFAFVRYKYQDEVQKAMEKSLMVFQALAYFTFCNTILMKVNVSTTHKGRMLEPVAKAKARSKSRCPRPRVCGGKMREWKLSRPSQALESALFMIPDWNSSWCATNVYLERSDPMISLKPDILPLIAEMTHFTKMAWNVEITNLQQKFFKQGGDLGMVMDSVRNQIENSHQKGTPH
ncbi:hypothetical protein M9H77_03781 [Catharanthus roseus]|uniref:Uncharacterized protein n=1 Tax=Catharanthus roseus TaxID=4058 RepID=A0ACC0CC49_CATRO|nr:hypothetical protein M9H77_03781 [Catharanthus roseus]